MRTVAQNHTRPIRAEISAGKLRNNFHAVRSAAGDGVEVLAVIKADGYGHGATECAPVLVAAGAEWLGVTSVEEGVAVRVAVQEALQAASHDAVQAAGHDAVQAAGHDAKQAAGPAELRKHASAEPRMLVMCGIWKGEEEACIAHRMTPVVWEGYHLDLLEAEGRRRGGERQLPVHLEIDTGMARQGVAPGEPLRQLLTRLRSASTLRLEGVLTHLASTECPEDPQNREQMRLFRQALQQVREAGLRPALVHAGNTSSTDSGRVPAELPALARETGSRCMTRAGLALYGYALPLEGGSPHLQPALQPVLTWKTCVVGLREVPPGSTVGYNAAFVAERAMRLALLPVGYADGFRRGLSSSNALPGGAVLLHGRRAPVVGRVSMDLTIVDVSGIPEVAIGSEAVLLGTQDGLHIRAEEHARLAGTSVYEVLCGISDRVPRLPVL